MPRRSAITQERRRGDEAAKQARSRQPALCEEEEREVQYYFERAQLVANAIGVAMAAFLVRTKRLERLLVVNLEKRKHEISEHDWIYDEGVLRYCRCGTWGTSGGIDKAKP